MDSNQKNASDARADAAQANRTNQCNPNHEPTGKGHNAAYEGAQYNLDNRSRQMNPQDSKSGSRK